MRLMYIQWAGDFGDTYKRLSKGQKEVYYAQSYTVDAVIEQAEIRESVAVLTIHTKTIYNEHLRSNLIAIGLGGKFARNSIYKHIFKFKPERIILRFPDWRILKFCRKNRIKVFPVFADSFEGTKSFREKVNQYLLGNELRSKTINWISNHQINAAKSIQALGVNPRRILPYDWKHESKPEDWSPKVKKEDNFDSINLLYCGSVIKSKGVFDVIRTLSLLRHSNKQVSLKIAGDGEISLAKEIATRCDSLSNIIFLGRIEHDAVLEQMNQADVVLVPSHHIYPEGLPMTIMESLMVHTPVVVSDHPMFKNRLSTGSAIEMVKEKSPEEIAKAVLNICLDKEEYLKRSLQTKNEWYRLNLDLKWSEMINYWLNDDNAQLKKHTLDRAL